MWRFLPIVYRVYLYYSRLTNQSVPGSIFPSNRLMGQSSIMANLFFPKCVYGDKTALLIVSWCLMITGSSLLQAEDIVGLLCNTGMYDEAIELCAMYNLPLTQIFQSLTFRLVSCTFSKVPSWSHHTGFFTYNHILRMLTYAF